GLFGNAEAMYGTENLYVANLFAAKFNRTERIGITANTNNMGGSGREGSLRMNNQIHGEPKNTSVGGNYENQLFDRKLNVNANYNFNNNSDRNERESYNQEIISDDALEETRRTSNNFSENQSHRISTHFRLRLDSTQNMDIRFNANRAQRENGSASTRHTTDGFANDINSFTSEQASINKIGRASCRER